MSKSYIKKNCRRIDNLLFKDQFRRLINVNLCYFSWYFSGIEDDITKRANPF